MHVLTRSYILIYVLAVEVDAWFVPTAAELRGIIMNIKKKAKENLDYIDELIDNGVIQIGD